ncbi:uncharacterized protein BJ212DRAFT_1318326 [Suillus subaureus]|uniref:Uncharacterized protein n=1 Tax=Suillus subaureus TaxID=48587 RepID=A0A9P7JJI1_9AGAM|nr:uncharacterized protein BJ212DRAFT_1318326 [Suillus subaureus]KAG1826150.1 hypothetical protein BJ212DRAFT_1318326 [Suillus subaureus]
MSFFEDIGRNNAQLSHLRTALAQLPHSIPLGNSKYNFEHYATIKLSLMPREPGHSTARLRTRQMW